MFGFFNKKSIRSTGIFPSLSDIHAHILPGVDDGIRTIEEAFKVLDFYESIGIQKVTFTPHVMEDYPQNTSEFLHKQFQLFQAAYQGKVALSLGAEYMLDTAFEKHFNRGKLLTRSDRQLLVETSYFNPPIEFESLLQKIQAKGYYVLLAHPERYIYMEMSDYQKLKRTQVRFQLNLLSLTGAYGQLAKQKAHALLKNGYYNTLGTDIHHLDFFTHEIDRKVISSEVVKQLQQLCERNI
ncbi:MAG: CpsB/CapC family capsule biosynthesis tyrosine phosphatase [Odoribacter sp.]